MKRAWWAMPAVIFAVGAGVALDGPRARAVIPEVGQAPSGVSIVDGLSDPASSAATLDRLVAARDLRTLSVLAGGSAETSARGWAIVGLARIGGADADRVLERIQEDTAHPVLVRTWAASARISMVPDLDALLPFAQVTGTFPGLDRPLGMRIEALVADGDLSALLQLATQPSLAPILSPQVLRASDADLVDRMLADPEDTVRRTAAGFAAAKANNDPRNTRIPEEVLSALAPSADRDPVPWSGGALYVPGLQWSPAESKDLVRSLMGWWLYLEAQDRSAELNQVWNNLYSYSLLTNAGYDMSLQPDAVGLVTRMAQVEGRGTARKLLAQIGLDDDPRFAKVIR